jgi:DNA replication protein DnaC
MHPCRRRSSLRGNRRAAPFQEWTEALGSKRLTGARLDRLTHRVHILAMNGESYRLKQSKRKRGSPPNS